MASEEILVGGDDGFALFERAAYELKRVAGASHGFNDDVNVGVLEKLFPVGVDLCACRRVGGLDTRATADGGDSEVDPAAMGDEVAVFLDDVGGGAADGAETDDADAHLLLVHKSSAADLESQRLKAPSIQRPCDAPEGAP